MMIKSTDWFEKVYRFLGGAIANALVPTPVTANMVTVFRSFVFFVCCAMALKPSFLNYLFVFIGIQLWDILDCTDGMLARAKNQSSDLGEFLEMFFDRTIGCLPGLFGLFLVVGLWYTTQSLWVMLFYAMIIYGWLMKTFFTHIDAIQGISKEKDDAWRTEARGIKDSFFGKVLFFFHYRELGVFSICVLLYPFISDIMFWYLAFYAVFHNVVWLGMAGIQWRTLSGNSK